MPFSSILGGADCKVYINGVLLGYITGIPQWNIDTEQREAREIDSNIPREIMPGMYRVSGAFSILRGRGTGGLEGAGMVASGQKMLLQKYLTIEVVDRLTNATVFRATQCQISRQTWSISPKQLVTGSFNWIGITFENEAKS